MNKKDLPYIDKRLFYTRSRYDSSNAYHIEEIFRSHRSIFQLAYEEKVGDKLYLFTHAGLLKGWYDEHKDLIGKLSVESLNGMYNTPGGIKALCEASRTRGGWDKYGSIVWNDVSDIRKNINDELPWDYQVFGHSQQEEKPIITNDFACLDCRKAFILDENGKFEQI